MKECRQVFQLAALIAIPYSYVAPSSYVETNINGTFNLLETLRILEEIKAPMLAKQRGAEMIEELSKIDGVDSVRGSGLLLAVEIEKESLANGDARDLAQACLKEGLVVNAVTSTALRLAPPLTISSEEIIEGASMLEKVLNDQRETT